jgi:chorismate mutase
MNVRGAEIVDVPFLNDYESGPDAAGRAEPETGELEPDLAALEERLRRLDHELLSLVQRRTDLARRLIAQRVGEGGTAYVHEQDLAVFRRFRALGPDGRNLAAMLVRRAATPAPAAGPTGHAGRRPADPSTP